ncbi:MAG: hypothetical protein U1E10_02505 [Bdellovibrionales bacterium]|nr:hypothetical protein [Bdellovibrionales bacterium]
MTKEELNTYITNDILKAKYDSVQRIWKNGQKSFEFTYNKAYLDWVGDESLSRELLRFVEKSDFYSEFQELYEPIRLQEIGPGKPIPSITSEEISQRRQNIAVSAYTAHLSLKNRNSGFKIKDGDKNLLDFEKMERLQTEKVRHSGNPIFNEPPGIPETHTYKNKSQEVFEVDIEKQIYKHGGEWYRFKKNARANNLSK